MSTDDRPSIAELQRQEREGSPFAAPTATRKALPVLLEIAAAALALREQEKAAAKLRHALREKYAPKDADYEAVDVADTELARRQARYDAALSKVLP